MNYFTASSGNVFTEHDGYVSVTDGKESLLIGSGTLGVALMDYIGHVRSSQQSEDDKMLGRWRFDAYTSVYARPSGGVVVLDERMPHVTNEFVRAHFLGLESDDDNRFRLAARAYFDAHPEPKPWHDAVEGEVWALSLGDDPEPRGWMAEGDGPRFWRNGHSINRTSGSITAGRRIWPEVAS